MGENKRLALLVVIMIGVAIVVGATAIGVIYDAALDRERARLVNMAQSQARLMEALAHFETPARTEGEHRRRMPFRRSWKRTAACASRESVRPPSCNSPAAKATSSCS